MKIPTINVFCTDFGQVRLSDQFVSEAESRWPGNLKLARFNLDSDGPDFVDTQEPAWVGPVVPAMNALMQAAEGANVRPVALKSLAALAPYGIEA